jgi:hypothetical protein
MLVVAVANGPTVNEPDCDRVAGNGSRHALAEMQWDTAL